MNRTEAKALAADGMNMPLFARRSNSDEEALHISRSCIAKMDKNTPAGKVCRTPEPALAEAAEC